MLKPEKLHLTKVRILKGQINCPEEFNPEEIEGFKMDLDFQMGFNLEEKQAKAEFWVHIFTESSDKNPDESEGSFHLLFLFHVENLEELAKPDKDGKIVINPGLANALASITYSTARGILLTRFNGTSLEEFILPVIDPNALFNLEDEPSPKKKNPK